MKMKHILPLLLFGGLQSYAQSNCTISDDHANAPSSATLLSFGASRNADIEVRHDRDFFCFDADAYAQFMIRVTPIGGAAAVKEAEVRLYQPNGFDRLAKASSTGNRPNAQIDFVNAGISRRIYVDVRSFSEYTAGRYQILVDRTGDPVDTDGDGLPDDWEDEHGFDPGSGVGVNGANGNPDGDSLSNLEEFKAGTNPRDAASNIMIVSSVGDENSRTISWAAAPYGQYQIYRTTNLMNPIWNPVSTVVNGDGTTAVYTDTNLAAGEFYLYRVEYLTQ